MGQKLVIGPLNKGLRNDREAFVIDNDSFPTLVNAYQWRGRIKRKRGTTLVGRLNRFIGTTDVSGNITVTINPEANPRTITSGISQFKIGTDIFQDIGSGTLITNGLGSGSLNLTTTVLTITGSQANTAVYYYPGEPVLGLRQFQIQGQQFPAEVAFDQTYAYQISTTTLNIYDVSFYKNPAANTFGSNPQKTTWTPLTWNAQDYQQYWTTNFAGALWATNGNATSGTPNPGMQVQQPNSATWVNATTMTFNITSSPAVVGDFVFVNEWTASGTNANTLNFRTGYVTVVSGANITVVFPNANIANDTYSGGMVQYLTNTVNSQYDGIRWYDGDPTNGGNYPPTQPLGWVNYAPPLSQAAFSIDVTPAAQYYLVGATMIYPFRDFLCFFGPYIQTTSGQINGTAPVWLQDTVIFSQNGSPYYTASFAGTPLSPTSINSMLVPKNQTATPSAMWEDVSGFGGYISSGVSQPILTLVPNEDVLILGYPQAFTRLIYTGNNLIPFLFYRINTELGAGSTFGAIIFDKGSYTIGNFGICHTTQVSSQRIDLMIPDQVFEISYANQGPMRVCAGRDFINEWVYITYPSNQVTWKFPNQTLMYNYRDDSWSILNECYTTYGTFRRTSSSTLSWSALTDFTWAEWSEPWDGGDTTIFAPELIAGNQQGFVVLRDTQTSEATSGYLQNITISGTVVTVTSPNHCLNAIDPYTNNKNYIQISGAQFTDPSVAPFFNGQIFSVEPIDANSFTLTGDATEDIPTSFTYVGGGLFTRLYNPYIQSKQFPLSWSYDRQTTIGNQMYLFTRTPNAQVTLNLYLSTDPDTPYNDPSSDAITFSNVLYTCPESTNLGLTPANINLQQINQIGPTGISSNNQAQIWHRMYTSLIGHTVQFGFNLSDKQMQALITAGTSYPITGITNANPCVLTCSSNFLVDDVITIAGVIGTEELNGNNYIVTDVTATTFTINTDSTNFGVYSSGGTATEVPQNNQFSEIEFHSAILDVKPSGLLA